MRSPFRVLLSVAVGMLLVAQRPAPGPLSASGRFSPERVAEIERAIRAEMERQRIPGLSAALVTEHQLRWAKGFGYADLENSVRATEHTVYRLASISKTITAVAVLQLVERGKLDLDAPIQRYCPAFPEKPWPITARHLLGHTSGIRHYKRPEEITSTRHYTRIVDALEIFKDDPLEHEPGARFTYTTYGYTVLGCAIEGASGMSYMDYVRENIFRPAGMDRARDDDVFALIPHRAQGYRRTPSGEWQNSPLADTSNKIPGGGLCSTVLDLARFAIALQQGKLLRRETLALMWTRQRTRDGGETSYGLGWSVSEYRGRREVFHTGGQPRVSTVLYMRPDDRLAVVLMSNLEGARLVDLARRIADLALS
jgi:CubicO group peptidase (beta-lactamase class C family)